MFIRYFHYNTSSSEIVYNILSTEPISKERFEKVIGSKLENESQLEGITIEIGPSPSFQTSWSTNALSILNSCGITSIQKIEKSHRFKISDYDGNYDQMTETIYEHGFKFAEKSFNEDSITIKVIPKEDIEKYGNEFGLTFDQADIDFYKNVVFKDRDPTDLELFDLAQSNSEHSRHWYFRGKLVDAETGIAMDETLFDLVKAPFKKQIETNSRIAFSDNASAIEGVSTIKHLRNGELKTTQVFPTFNAETHNFPTAIAPFQGASTGVGGRIRDTQAVGRGGLMMAGTAGYSVNSERLLVEASNGASDYGNKIGEPITLGFCRFFDYDQFKDGKRIAFEKPIMFSGGIGQILHSNNLNKKQPKKGMKVVRLGGPAYRIGLGGGTASSRSIQHHNLQNDLSAVQRGDPEMENKLNKVLMWCINELDANPIQSIHDQGAGGMANVTKEIVTPNGATINLDYVNLGDDSMNSLEIWCSEFQEQVTILLNENDVDRLKDVAARERCPIEIIGEIDDSGEITVFHKNQVVEKLNLDQILENVPQKTFRISQPLLSEEEDKRTKKFSELEYSPFGVLRDVLSYMSVGSKRFLTNKVDRSVSGLIAQQQCVGPYHTPISDCTVVANSHFDITGIASSIGEKSTISIKSPAIMSRLVVCEMLTNLIGAPITKMSDIKCSGNWMWPLKNNGVYDEKEGYKLYQAVKSLSDSLCALNIPIDGGKDSLSMSKNGVPAPGTLVLSSYVGCTDIRKVVGSDIKLDESDLIYVNFGEGKFHLGGSIFEENHSQLFDHALPDIKDWRKVKFLFDWIQKSIHNGFITAIHDVSDGGLITTICEMCMAGDKGCKIDVSKNIDWHKFWFSEEPGVVFECRAYNLSKMMRECPSPQSVYQLGLTKNKKTLHIHNNSNCVWKLPLSQIRRWWETSSRKCEYLQTNEKCVNEEYDFYNREFDFTDKKYGWNLKNFEMKIIHTNLENSRPSVAILREEGSNGEREMTAAFYHANFQVHDITMKDLIDSPDILEKFNIRGIVFVGGFSYSDVFGAGQGWAQTILNNDELRESFNRFYEREDTFSLGICNGCQVMSKLGWVGNCQFTQNDSKKFESRFCTVEIMESNCIFFDGMEGLKMGIWCAHGEGKYEESEECDNIKTIRYVDMNGNETERYPHNPNGSKSGITGVCSKNGRHLAMMPHPERSFLKWQQAWRPYTFKKSETEYSEWFQMFVNARNWCK